MSNTTTNQRARVAKPAPKTWVPKGTDGEKHKCRGCAKRLPATKFPTTDQGPAVRGTECRTCRDARTDRATKRLLEPARVAKAAARKTR